MTRADRLQAAVVASLGLLTACGSSSPTTPTPAQVTPPTLVSAQMTGANVTIPAVGGTVQLHVLGTYSDGSMQDVTSMMQIGSSDWTVASSSFVQGQAGLVTAWTVGQVTITAYTRSLVPMATGTITVASGPAPNAALVSTLLSPDDGAMVVASQTGILTFNWSAVPGAAAYHLDFKSDSAPFPAVEQPNLANPPFQIATGGYDTGIPWHWRVQAQVSGVFQAWSSPRLVTFTGGTLAPASSAASPWPMLLMARPPHSRARPGPPR